MAKYLLGLDGQAKMASFAAHKPGKWTLLPRKRAGPAINIETPAQFVWHFANAAEDGQGRLVVDACEWGVQFGAFFGSWCSFGADHSFVLFSFRCFSSLSLSTTRYKGGLHAKDVRGYL